MLHLCHGHLGWQPASDTGCCAGGHMVYNPTVCVPAACPPPLNTPSPPTAETHDMHRHGHHPPTRTMTHTCSSCSWLLTATVPLVAVRSGRSFRLVCARQRGGGGRGQDKGGLRSAKRCNLRHPGEGGTGPPEIALAMHACVPRPQVPLQRAHHTGRTRVHGSPADVSDASARIPPLWRECQQQQHASLTWPSLPLSRPARRALTLRLSILLRSSSRLPARPRCRPGDEAEAEGLSAAEASEAASLSATVGGSRGGRGARRGGCADGDVGCACACRALRWDGSQGYIQLMAVLQMHAAPGAGVLG